MPRSTPEWLIVLAASAGGVRALQTIVRALPAGLPAAVVVLLHRPPDKVSHLEEVLRRAGPLAVATAHGGDVLQSGCIYVPRPDQHLLIVDHRFQYRDGQRIRFVRSSANPLLESAAAAFPNHLIAVVLTGTGADATDGVQTVKKYGGIVMAQDRTTSEHWDMPAAAVQSGAVDYVLPLPLIAPALVSIVHGQSILTNGMPV